MPQTVYDETFDGKGNVLSSTPRDIPDVAPTDKEKIAQLEAKLLAVTSALDDTAKSASFAEAKTKIADRIKDVKLDAVAIEQALPR